MASRCCTLAALLLSVACDPPAGGSRGAIYDGEEVTNTPVPLVTSLSDNERGSGVFVTDRWVLTALHLVHPSGCDTGAPPGVTVAYRAPGAPGWSEYAGVDGVVCHAELDVALLHLARSVPDVVPAAYSTAPPGGRLTCVGYGDVGIGDPAVDRLLAVHPTAGSFDLDRLEGDMARLVRAGDAYIWHADSGGGCFRPGEESPWILEGVIAAGECDGERATWAVRSDAIADWVFETARLGAAPRTREDACDYGCDPACPPGQSCVIDDGALGLARCVVVGDCLPLVRARVTSDQILAFGGDEECAEAWTRASCSVMCGAGAALADVERVRECMRARCAATCERWPEEPLCGGCSLVDRPFCELAAWQRRTSSALGSPRGFAPGGCD